MVSYEPRKFLHIRVTSTDNDRLETLAGRLGLNLSSTIRVALHTLERSLAHPAAQHTRVAPAVQRRAPAEAVDESRPGAPVGSRWRAR